MKILINRRITGLAALLVLWLIYNLTSPSNHSEAEDVYDFALKVEQGSFADQAGVNRVLALPVFGIAYKAAQAVGYSGRAFPFMIFINRLLAVGSIILFWRMGVGRWALGVGSSLSVDRSLSASAGRDGAGPSTNTQSLTPSAQCLMPSALFLAFSYGFWRYANEAETYILASFLVLSAWFLVLKGKMWWGVGVSALGVLVHLLNLIPLLLIIPFYYLLSKDWKKALLHGGLTGVLVLVGYALCSPWLDFDELGAQHHKLEGGLGFENMVRGGIAFGQCVISGNFLFGFESFRELLSGLFPSRMLDEEFYMAAKMGGWIKWAGVATLSLLGVWGLMLGVRLWTLGVRRRGVKVVPRAQCLMPNAFILSMIVWLLLYAVAVIRTEAGSPELWIMALIPFWLLLAPLLALRANFSISKCSVGSMNRILWALAGLLFLHNLIGGLLPVMSGDSDYHAAKGKWLVENCGPDDLVLMDYEPVMVFYLDYYSKAMVLNSGQQSLNQIEEALGMRRGNAYAVASFFQPLESMRVRSPNQFEKMLATGDALFPKFEKMVDDEFGGIYQYGR